MIIFKILIGIVIMGGVSAFILHKYTKYSRLTNNLTSVMGIMAFFALFGLLIITMTYLTKNREYREFSREQASFIFTIEAFRKNGREMESAAIISGAVDLNLRLTNFQYKLSRPIVKDFYDDRFNDLKLIE